VPNTELKKSIESLCPEIDREIIQDFFARMDEDYFSTFLPEEISKHIALSCRLDTEHRICVRITPDATTPDEFTIVIVGFDYLAEFSVFCGLLSAFGLDIRSGDIYSFARRAVRASRPLPRKIVDVFKVASKPGETFDETKQREFQQELQVQAQMLAEGSVDQARERLNRFLIERIERMNEPLSGLLSPVQIQFNNEASPEWTVVEAQSDDSFALLYAISNALSMRGIYIHKVKIRTATDRAMDRFFVVDRWGHKIKDAGEQERLRMAVAMIKQFTSFLPEAPDPAKAMRHFDQFLDKISEEELPEHIISFFSSKEGMNVLAHLLGSSDFLWDEFLRTHFAELVSVLENFGKTQEKPFKEELQPLLKQASTLDEKKKILNSFKDRQLFLIDIRHLLDSKMSLTGFSQALTELAEAVIEEAAAICVEHLGGAPHPFTICGLGKFGGCEMGYASDLELLFVHEGEGSTPFFESLVRQVLGFIEARSKGIFHIDTRLRPYGEKGAMSTPFAQFAKYYSMDGPAAPFERQALIKLRHVAGDESLGRRVEVQRDAFTYSDAPWDWEDALHLRKRQMKELVKRGETNVKYSPGGIVDIEYAVQYLQIVNGKDHPEVRMPNTLAALDRLRRLQIVREVDYEVLNKAYLFLRNLIDALRIVRGDASDLVLPEESSEEFKSLARRLGYRDQDRNRSATRLATDIRGSMKKVNEYFMNRFSAV
jgi:[glutamine synthetase] adenylyltransferase / [glutamine synthetase]-adenylyl-L-tyrosine phosphorylase